MNGLQYFSLRIGSVNIEIESESSVALSARCRYFETENAEPDVRFVIRRGEYDISRCGVINDAGNIQIRQNREEILRIQYADRTQRIIQWVVRQKKNGEGRKPYVYEVYVSDSGADVLKNINPLQFVELSGFFIYFDAVVLHSAVIRYDGEKGVAFTAPSGTGKSTQASLWEKYRDAEILNGDRGIIRKTGDGYHVFGSPYAGSSRIYRNQHARLRAVAVISQAKTNRVTRLDKKSAYIRLFSELSVSGWNRDTVERQAQWLEKFVDCVPVYLLECLPDQGAVDSLYQELEAD